jgi:hypothetical protein
MRGAEILLFSLGALGAAVVLVGQPGCPVCRGAMRKRRIATLPADAAKDALKRLSDFAAVGNVAGFRTLISDLEARQNDPSTTANDVELWAYRCAVCGSGMFSAMTVGKKEPARDQADHVDVARTLVDPYFTPDGRPVGASGGRAKRFASRAFTSRPSAPP